MRKRIRPVPIDGCFSCLSISGVERISPGPTIFEGEHWLVEHAYPSALLGWTVIVLRRHSEALHDLTDEEFQELASLQRAVCLCLNSEMDCEKEYSVCFAEVEGFSHIHFHLVPRAADMAEDKLGAQVFGFLKSDNPVDPAVVAEWCEKMQPLVAMHMGRGHGDI